MHKILVYSHDTYGLGNIRRMLAISCHLVATLPDVSILLVSGSPMVHAFRIPERIDYVKLPCLGRTEADNYGVRYLGMDSRAAVQMRSDIIRAAVVDFDPDLILVDKKPLGVGNELAPALEYVRSLRPNTRLALLLRDILDIPEQTMRVWEKNRYHDAIASLYDLVLVVGSPEIFDLNAEYQFPQATSDKVQFCGYLERERSALPPPAVRQRFGFDDRDLVLVTSGGGADGHRLLSSYLQGLAEIPEERRPQSLVVCGPEMPARERDEIHFLANGSRRIRVEEFVDDMMSCMAAADLTVSMGGYNTVCELLTLGKRAIVVPRVDPVQEQWIRAERMAERGLFRAIHPAELSPQSLIRAVQEELLSKHAPPTAADLGGLDRISHCLSCLLRREEPGFRPACTCVTPMVAVAS